MMMKMHHMGAINMTQKELVSSSGDMRTFAQNVIASQQAKITQFTSFLSAHQPTTPAVMAFDTEAMQAMDKMTRAADLRVLTSNTDQNFAQLMQDYHQSAVEMAQSELKYRRVASMKALAQQIINEQTAEIKTLQTWLLASKGY